MKWEKVLVLRKPLTSYFSSSSKSATDVKVTADMVKEALEEAEKAQNAAEKAIKLADEDIKGTQDLLTSVSFDSILDAVAHGVLTRDIHEASLSIHIYNLHIHINLHRNNPINLHFYISIHPTSFFPLNPTFWPPETPQGGLHNYNQYRLNLIHW